MEIVNILTTVYVCGIQECYFTTYYNPLAYNKCNMMYSQKDLNSDKGQEFIKSPEAASNTIACKIPIANITHTGRSANQE